MSSANDNTQTVTPPPKRLRSKSSDKVSSQSDDWFSVVLNEIELFKLVNPAKNLVNGAESNSQRRQKFSSNLSPFSTNFLSEDLIGKMVETLGILLEEVKKDIWITISNRDHLIPASFLREFNKLVHDSHPDNIKTPFIKCVEEFRSFISRIQPSYLFSVIELFKNALDSYYRITTFIICYSIIWVWIFYDLPPNAREILEVFTWYFRLVVRSQLHGNINMTTFKWNFILPISILLYWN
ncbi:unnamed protein product [Rhizophagus irregularis]|nr:unnamed protein product [Rhizophagus irregularis]